MAILLTEQGELKVPYHEVTYALELCQRFGVALKQAAAITTQDDRIEVIERSRPPYRVFLTEVIGADIKFLRIPCASKEMANLTLSQFERLNLGRSQGTWNCWHTAATLEEAIYAR